MTDAAARTGWAHHPVVYAAALLLILLCLIPPTGVLSDNEEDYFGLAAQAVSHIRPSPETAVSDASPHRFVNEFLLGHLIAATGFETAQVVARSLAAVAYAFLLGALLRHFALSALDAVLVVIVFALMGQTLIGGEWLFGDYEAKIPAYCFVLAGLRLAVTRRTMIASTLLFAAATYFHFLVGVFWFFAAIGLVFIGDRRALWRLTVASLVFIAAVAPLFAVIAWSRLAAPDPAIALSPLSPDYIYSIIRAPHHTAPFLAWDNFVAQWLPGYLLAGAMLAGCVVIARTAEGRGLSAVAWWLAALLAYLLLALLLAFIDRDAGSLGKFYLFRPAALSLLLWLILAMAYLDAIGLKRLVAVKLVALALIAPSFLLGTVNRVSDAIHNDRARIADAHPIWDFLARQPSSDSVVLIDPQIEYSFLDFERRTGRPMLVTWKFMPTNDRGIIEWYRRISFRKALFESGCSADTAYSVAFLLTTPEHAAALTKNCGPIVYATERYALLRRGG